MVEQIQGELPRSPVARSPNRRRSSIESRLWLPPPSSRIFPLKSSSALSGMSTLSPFVLEVLVFTTLLFVLVFAWFGPISFIAYRRRCNRRRFLLAQQQTAALTSESDIEKDVEAGIAAPGSGPHFAPVMTFLRWRQRVLYPSDSIPELAVLPWYQREESASRRLLNFVLRKKPAKVSLIRPS